MCNSGERQDVTA